MPSEVLGSCGRAPNFTAALQHPKPAYGSLPADTAVPHIAPCPDTSRCPPSGAKRTVFVYNGGKEDAAFGNLFYATATNAVLYASHKRYVPLMRLQRELVWRTMGSVWAKRNTTLWQEFFQPFCANVSSWMEACPETVQRTQQRLAFWYPGVAHRFHWSVHQWYNVASPAQRACEGRNPAAAREGVAGNSTCWQYNETYFRRWRRDGHAVVSRYRIARGSMDALEERWRSFLPAGSSGPTLGLHMRGSDKRSGRRKVYPCVFDPYVADFFARFPAGRVYVATESIGYAEHAKKAWGERWGLDRVLVPSLSTRVSSKTANFRVLTHGLVYHAETWRRLVLPIECHWNWQLAMAWHVKTWFPKPQFDCTCHEPPLILHCNEMWAKPLCTALHKLEAGWANGAVGTSWAWDWGSFKRHTAARALLGGYFRAPGGTSYCVKAEQTSQLSVMPRYCNASFLLERLEARRRHGLARGQQRAREGATAQITAPRRHAQGNESKYS